MSNRKDLFCNAVLCLKSVFIGILILLSSYHNSYCQEDPSLQDTIKIKHHSPRAAIVLSVLVPGMGQIYNGKIWKVPIIYAAEGTALYLYNFNQVRYKKILNYLESDTFDESQRYEVYGRSLGGSVLPRARDFFRKNRDYSILFFGGVYVLNIIDALVDAHFFEYDISDDLSLNIQPVYYSPEIKAGGPGLQLVFTF
ncbi:MAG: hypothetical protein JXB00_01605 [Bacteroidales bacterium]|nr:hypothetical protein [Bacteroidales bacterium]